MKSLFLKISLWTCVALLSVACSNREKLSDREFLIEGKISGLEDSTVIHLARLDGDMNEIIASNTVMNGRFTFKEEAVSNPEQMMIIPRGDGFSSRILYVWVAPKTRIRIEGNGKIHPTWSVKSSIPYQKEENRYTDKNRDVIAESARISVEENAVFSKIMAATSSEETLPFRKIVDSLRVITDSLIVEELYGDIGIMEKTDISPVWLDRMNGVSGTLKYIQMDAERKTDLRKKVEELYSRMSEEDRNTPLGYRITAELFPPTVVNAGDDMADADLLDTDGNTKHLSDYLGKYLLLDFWSRGCGPCIMALPEMKEISETYKDKLTVISISLDTENVWKKTMSEHDMPWVNIRDPKSMGGVAANYGVTGIPNYIMISPEGKIIDKWMGFGEGFLREKVSANLK
ncbi:MAG: AhpC/TSA family protein [Tannerella sp.]|jgi:peroxiredoxin|nr:AhpC/TSA family protein [Tannerella sp.]